MAVVCGSGLIATRPHTDDLRRHTTGNGVLRDIFINDRTCRNHRTGTDFHAGQHRHPVPQSGTISNRDRPTGGEFLLHDWLPHFHTVVVAIDCTASGYLDL